MISLHKFIFERIQFRRLAVDDLFLLFITFTVNHAGLLKLSEHLILDADAPSESIVSPCVLPVFNGLIVIFQVLDALGQVLPVS